MKNKSHPIHLQWFANEPVLNEFGVAGPNYASSELSDIEVIVGEPPVEAPVVDPTDPYSGLTPAELRAKLDEQVAANTALQGQASQAAAIQAGIASLKQSTPQQGAPAPQPPPGMSPAELAEYVKEKLYEDPVGSMDKYFQYKIAPEVRNLMQNNLNISRRFLQLDPERSSTYAQYGAEIDQEMINVPPQTKLSDVDIYQKVHDQVVSRHAGDIIKTKVEAAVKEALAKQAAPAPVKPGVKPVTYTEVGTNPPVAKGSQKVYLTPAEDLARRTTGGNVTPKVYYAYLKRKGLK